MPTNLVKSKQDEEDWAEARRIVDKQYPDKSPDDKDKSYWKLTTSIYENIKKNRGKKQMQKQASVGELLAGQLKLRKQADGNAPRSGVVGRIGDKLNDWLGWKKRPRGWSNPPKRTPDPVPTRPSDPVPTRPPAPAPNWYPMPKWSPQPAPAPRPFPIPRGIRGPWGQPEEQPNDPMENERIRRLVEGNKAPAPGGGSVGRPVDDSEIPLPSEDPGGASPAPNNRPSNTPPINPPKMTEEELNRIMREWQKGIGRNRHYDPGWNNEPGWYERMRWPNRYPEVERPYNERGNNLPGWYDPNGPYYQRGVGRNGEIDPRGINIPPDNWVPFRQIPARVSYQDSQF